MHIAVYLLSGLNLACFLAFAFLGPDLPDAAGQGWVTLIGIILAVFHVPALILASARRAVPFALVLVLIPFLFAALTLFRTAVG